MLLVVKDNAVSPSRRLYCFAEGQKNILFLSLHIFESVGDIISRKYTSSHKRINNTRPTAIKVDKFQISGVCLCL